MNPNEREFFDRLDKLDDNSAMLIAYLVVWPYQVPLWDL
jgi:hypothetical protein